MAAVAVGCCTQTVSTRPAPGPAASRPAIASVAAGVADQHDYAVADLVGSGADLQHALADLGDYVEQNVDPNGWQDHGGDVGTLEPEAAHAVLRIRQTPANHRRIAALLAALRAKPRTATTAP